LAEVLTIKYRRASCFIVSYQTLLDITSAQLAESNLTNGTP